MTDKGIIEVQIDGNIIQGIQSIKIETDCRKCYAWFEMDLIYVADDIDIFEPFLYPTITISYNDKIVFTGIVEALDKTTKQSIATLRGRTRTAFLVDCSFVKNYTFQNTKLNNIVSQVCADYNIDVVSSNYDSEELEKVNFHLGENIYCQLSELASLCSIDNTIPLISTNANGALVVGKNITESDSLVYEFSKEDDNIDDMRVSFDGSRRIYKYKCFSQNTKDTHIESLDIIDNDISLTEKIDYSLCSGANINECNNRAKFERAIDISNANKVEISIPTWVDKNGDVLDTGKLISIGNQECMIFGTQTFLIERIRYLYSSKRFNTELKVTPKDTYKV